MPVTIRPNVSPRIIEVPRSEGDEISAQSLHDQLTAWEDQPPNMSYERIILSSGKKDLGGGALTGITAELQDAQVEPEANTTVQSEGTATSNDATGEILIDSGATFEADGVVRGSWLVNFTDLSVSSVVTVDSETQLTIKPLQAGSVNDWGIGDVYKIWNMIPFDLNGGNVIAVDSLGDELLPIYPSFGRTVVRTNAISATLSELSSIQFASFQNGVTIDVINGVAGTAFPTGTGERPSNNFTDAETILNSNGLRTFFIRGDFIIPASATIANKIFIGEGHDLSSITLTAAASITNSTFKQATINGTVDGGSQLDDCNLQTVNFFDGNAFNCSFDAGTTTLSGLSEANLINCYSSVAGGAPGQKPIIDMGGSGTSLITRGWRGGLKLINWIGGDAVSLGFAEGELILDSTITGGTITVRGLVDLEDNSTGTTVNVEGALSQELIREAVWATPTGDAEIAGSMGERLQLVEAIMRNKVITDPGAGVMTVFAADGITPLMTANLFEGTTTSQPYRDQGWNRKERLVT